MAKSLIITAIFALVFAGCRTAKLHPVLSIAWSFLGLAVDQGPLYAAHTTGHGPVPRVTGVATSKVPGRPAPRYALGGAPHVYSLGQSYREESSGVVLIAAWTAGEMVHRFLLRSKLPLAWTTLATAAVLIFGADLHSSGKLACLSVHLQNIMSKRTLAKSLVLEMTPDGARMVVFRDGVVLCHRRPGSFWCAGLSQIACLSSAGRTGVFLPRLPPQPSGWRVLPDGRPAGRGLANVGLVDLRRGSEKQVEKVVAKI